MLMLHAGLDLCRRRLDVCLVNEAGELVEHTAAAPDADGLRHLVERLGGVRVRAVIESMTCVVEAGGGPLAVLGCEGPGRPHTLSAAPPAPRGWLLPLAP